MDKSKHAAKIFNSKALLYEKKYMDVGLYAPTLNQFSDLLASDKATVLDLACGPGNITKYLLQRKPAFKIFGIDLAPKMLERAAINNPSATFQLMDCRAIGTLTQRFEGIMCGFCLPYLNKEEALQLIADSYGLLQRNGVLYISTMEGDYETSGFKAGTSKDGEEIFIHYHQADYLSLEMKRLGFHDIKLHRIAYTSEEETVTDLILLATK